MDREILVSEALSREMIEAGRLLVDTMKNMPTEGSVVRVIDAAFWVREKDEDFDRWRLVIAAPGISFEDPRKGYEWAHRAYSSISIDLAAGMVPSDMIVVADTNSPVIEALRTSFGFSPVSDKHLRQAFLGRRYFEELFIYHLDPVKRIECKLLDPDSLNLPPGENHVFVFGERLADQVSSAIVAHGRLQIVDGDRNVLIDLPTKYKIASGDAVECRPWLSAKFSTPDGETYDRLSNVLVKRRST